jgi:hypothetical protein
MYDVSGIKGGDVEKGIRDDWEHLVSMTRLLKLLAAPNV